MKLIKEKKNESNIEKIDQIVLFIQTEKSKISRNTTLLLHTNISIYLSSKNTNKKWKMSSWLVVK